MRSLAGSILCNGGANAAAARPTDLNQASGPNADCFEIIRELSQRFVAKFDERASAIHRITGPQKQVSLGHVVDPPERGCRRNATRQTQARNGDLRPFGSRGRQIEQHVPRGVSEPVAIEELGSQSASAQNIPDNTGVRKRWARAANHRMLAGFTRNK